jgi:hypothetical protein
MSLPFAPEHVEFRAAVHAPSRKLLQEQMCREGKLTVSVASPCGLAGGRIYTAEALPRKNLACPCGKPGCWLVYYDREPLPR